MSRSVLFKVCAALVSILAPFFFPWECTFMLSIVASFFFPPAALLSGFLLDTLYSSGKALPYFSILGLVISIAAYFVQQFVKTRIMS